MNCAAFHLSAGMKSISTLIPVPASEARFNGRRNGIPATGVLKTSGTRLNLSFLFLVVLLLVAAPSARAQNFAIDWFSVAGGGNTSDGGVFSVSGSIGQPDAGTLSGGSFTLDGGFWGAASESQPTSAPSLNIRLSGADCLLSWPAPSAGFELQETSSLDSPADWKGAEAMVMVVGSENTAKVPASGAVKFFRLRHR